jgi:large subunit ribosomal protein L5
MASELQQRYQKDIQPKLIKELGMKNVMQAPRILKVVVNVGMGSYMQRLGTKDYGTVEETLNKITGQKPVLRKSRMSVSNFKLREGMPVGMCVTLRGESAYDFLDKVINVVFPRVRGFRGVKRNIFDKDGNCSFGFNEHTVFPEVDVEDPRKVHGVQVTIVTSTKDPVHTEKMLEEMSFPFIKKHEDKEETN